MSVSCEDSEECSVYRCQVRKARKQYKCKACGLPIMPGHYYSYTFLVWDGSRDQVRRCGACETTYQHLLKLCRESAPDMQPDLELGCGLKYVDEWGGDPPDEIARLPFLTDDERGQLLKERV